jgi:hypothetical protein
MKKVIVLVLVILMANAVNSQSLFQEWEKYLKDCNELVADSVDQSGMINCELVPVTMNGKTVSYSQAPVDTVWNKVACNSYKYGMDYGHATLKYWDDHIVYTNASNLLYIGDSIRYTRPKAEGIKINISRTKICMIKKRKATWEDFWDRWCKEQGIVEFN